MIEQTLLRHPFRMASLILLTSVLGAALYSGLKPSIQKPASVATEAGTMPSSVQMDQVIQQLTASQQMVSDYLKSQKSVGQLPPMGQPTDQPVNQKTDFSALLASMQNKVAPEDTLALIELQSRREQGLMDSKTEADWKQFIGQALKTKAATERVTARLLLEELWQMGESATIMELAAQPQMSQALRLELLHILPELQSPLAQEQALQIIGDLTQNAPLSEVLAALPQAQVVLKSMRGKMSQYLQPLQRRICGTRDAVAEQLRWQLIRNFGIASCEDKI